MPHHMAFWVMNKPTGKAVMGIQQAGQADTAASQPAAHARQPKTSTSRWWWQGPWGCSQSEGAVVSRGRA